VQKHCLCTTSIKDYLMLSRNRKAQAKSHIDAVIGELFAACREKGRLKSAWSRLLGHVRLYSNILQLISRGNHFLWQQSCEFTKAMFTLALHHEDWVRPIDTWRPKVKMPYSQFVSLAGHLFAVYPVPFFMNSVWFKGTSGQAIQRQEWFKHIGRGQNIRTAEIPLHLTKKMAHHFIQAPSHFSVEQALRWGQVLGMGGDERLAHTVWVHE